MVEQQQQYMSQGYNYLKDTHECISQLWDAFLLCHANYSFDRCNLNLFALTGSQNWTGPVCKTSSWLLTIAGNFFDFICHTQKLRYPNSSLRIMCLSDSCQEVNVKELWSKNWYVKLKIKLKCPLYGNDTVQSACYTQTGRKWLLRHVES